MLLAAAGPLLLPSITQAACPPAVRADARATAAIAAQLRSTGAAGADDVTGLYARARRSCADMRPARAIAIATQRLGLPVPGQRANVRGVPLVGTTVGPGVAWRLDLKQVALRIATSTRRGAIGPHVALLRSAAGGTVALTISSDPTRTAWDPKVQALVATIIGTSAYADSRALGDATVRAFAVRGRIPALARLPLIEHLRIANRVAAVGARSDDAMTNATSSNLAVRAMVRIRASRARAWSRTDGAWSTGPQHRALVAQSALLLRRHPHANTGRVVESLQASLRTSATVGFKTLPIDEFYPWPRDGAFDTQTVMLDVDKPATVTMLVYGTDDTPIRSISTEVDPGMLMLTWDGANDAGAIQEAGDYRYNVDLVDPVGNRARVPGLERFRIARDTTPPTVETATVRVIGSGAARRIVVSWAVAEQHSPRVTTWLLLTSGDRTERFQLHDSLQRATVRKPLSIPAGTWRATLVFGDGSGNRASQPAGSFEIRAGSS